jgi:excisionase family DNA binding protein
MEAVEEQHQEGRWVSLGAACRLLGVNESTLRSWADGGVIRAFRTPGGHRRFLRDDLYASLQRTKDAQPSHTMNAQAFSDGATRRIRRLLHGEHAESFSWYDEMDDATRGRLRLYGRRLLDVTAAMLSKKRPSPQAMEEVRLIGEEYGEALAERGLTLRELMEAFVFFRTPLTESVRASSRKSSPEAEELTQAWQQVETVADMLMIAMADAYERSRNGKAISAV